MKKVLIFLLTLAVALGGIGFAHAAVTDSQDELVIYPARELGDRTVVEGLTASMTYTCGEHLRWYTDHTFGGGTETEFAYSRTGFGDTAAGLTPGMDVYLSGGVGTSITGGDLSLNGIAYSELFRTVANATAAGENKTMELEVADYVNYYFADYGLEYQDEVSVCDEEGCLHNYITGGDWSYPEGQDSHEALTEHFRFPTQPGDIFSVTIGKDSAGRINELDIWPEDGPELQFISDVNAHGIWFVPVFRDADGAPLAYESPAGHGVYYIPWSRTGTIHRYSDTDLEVITPDWEKLELVLPLDERLSIEHMEIDGETGECWMLTLEKSSYVLTAFDLNTGEELLRLDVLPHAGESHYGHFVRADNYLILTAEDHMALVDTESRTLLLTAPDAQDESYGANRYTPADGSLRFDGETLILVDTAFYRDAAFWAAAYRQGELVYYGEYECSLMRGNDDWYYSYITTEEYPIDLK